MPCMRPTRSRTLIAAQLLPLACKSRRRHRGPQPKPELHSKKMRGTSLLLLTTITLSACGTSTPNEQDPAKETSSSGDTQGSAPTSEGQNTDSTKDTELPEEKAAVVYSPCALDSRWGQFKITLKERFSSAQGFATNGVVPDQVPKLVKSVGECKLYQPPTLSCDPPCGVNERCDRSGSCIPVPRNQDLGKLVFRGMQEDLDLEARSPGNHYLNSGTLAHPVILQNQTVRLIGLEAPGGPLNLHAHGFEALGGVAEKYELQKGKELALSWNAPQSPEHSKMLVNLNVNNHGANASWIACVFEDNGSAKIPATLLDDLQAAGLSGFPSIELNRSSVDSARLQLQPQGEGCVELVVESAQVADVVVPGLLSCNEDSDCPDGQSCKDDLTCG